MKPIISISGLCKTYSDGHEALKSVDLDIMPGEILALLGPNGAGKTTLISIVCGIVKATSGSVTVAGHDIVTGYRSTRAMIGLVPQELTLGAFDRVRNTVSFSRGMFGKKPDPGHVDKVLEDLSLLDKKDAEVRLLSGGMKRRVLIAKALSHQPRILFLDEPTAGVDVELRQDMWQIVRRLRESGVTIILTTHYIEEAEEIADRVGVINNGELLVVDEKLELMRKLGKKELHIELKELVSGIPESLQQYGLVLSSNGCELTYTYDIQSESTGITNLLQDLKSAGLTMKDLNTAQSSLEDIFVNLVRRKS